MKGSSWCSSYNVEERGPQSLSLGLNTTACISCRSYYYNYCHYSPQSRSFWTSWLTSRALPTRIARNRSCWLSSTISARLAPDLVKKRKNRNEMRSSYSSINNDVNVLIIIFTCAALIEVFYFYVFSELYMCHSKKLSVFN